MKTVNVITFKGTPGMLVNIAGQNESLFRFDETGVHELIDDGSNPYVEKLKRRFEYTETKYRLTKAAGKEAEADG